MDKYYVYWLNSVVLYQFLHKIPEQHNRNLFLENYDGLLETPTQGQSIVYMIYFLLLTTQVNTPDY